MSRDFDKARNGLGLDGVRQGSRISSVTEVQATTGRKRRRCAIASHADELIKCRQQIDAKERAGPFVPQIRRTCEPN